MRGRTKMIVGENSSHGAVNIAVVHEGIDIPALNSRLSAQPADTYGAAGGRGIIRTRLAPQSVGVGGTIKDVLGRRVRRFISRAAGIHQRHAGSVDESVGGTVVDGPDHLLHFSRGKGAVLVIETITGAVRRGHVKLHQVYMLAENVCRRAHLEVIDQVVVGYQVGMPILDDVSRVATEEKRLRRTPRFAVGEIDRGLDILP